MASRFAVLAATLVVTAVSTVTRATPLPPAPLTVDFQFVSNPAHPYTGVGAYTGDGVASGSVTWNPLGPASGSGVYASNGATLATPITFSSTASGVGQFYQPVPSNSTSADIPTLLGQGIYGYGDTHPFTLTNVPQGTYDVYLYSSLGQYSYTGNGAGTEFTLSTTLSNPPSAISTTQTPDTAFAPGGSYVVIPVIVGADGTITGNYARAPGSNQVEFNGIQLVQLVPEPASMAIVGIGCVGLLARRRRA